jgi:chemotaxis protein histidine kinase CheA
MSLEQLRAQAEEIESQDQPEMEDQPELDVEQPEEPEVDETENDGDSEFELELEGDSPAPAPSKPKPEEALVYKLTKEKKKRQAAQNEASEKNAEIEQLRQEIEALKSGNQPVNQLQDGEPTFPVMYTNGVETKEDYDQAVKKYFADMAKYESKSKQLEQSQAQVKEQVKAQAESLARDAGRLIEAQRKVHKNLNEDAIIEAIESAQDQVESHLNIEGSFTYLLNSLGEKSADVAYFLGRNEKAMGKLKQVLDEDPNGLKAVAYLTELKHRLKPTTKKTSSAPEPDEPVKGDAVPKNGAALKKAYEDAANKGDFNKLKEIRRQARESGVSLD